MTRYKWMVMLFLLSFFFTMIGAYLKITHLEGGDNTMLAGIILSVIAIGLAIYEVVTTHDLSVTRKVLWVFAFVCFGWIGFLFYLLIGRKDVVEKREI